MKKLFVLLSLVVFLMSLSGGCALAQGDYLYVGGQKVYDDRPVQYRPTYATGWTYGDYYSRDSVRYNVRNRSDSIIGHSEGSIIEEHGSTTTRYTDTGLERIHVRSTNMTFGLEAHDVARRNAPPYRPVIRDEYNQPVRHR